MMCNSFLGRGKGAQKAGWSGKSMVTGCSETVGAQVTALRVPKVSAPQRTEQQILRMHGTGVGQWAGLWGCRLSV